MLNQATGVSASEAISKSIDLGEIINMVHESLDDIFQVFVANLFKRFINRYPANF